MITGRELVEKHYSEIEDSTGDGELDDLLEKAFCEGYEYAQREFGNKQNKAAQRQWRIDQELANTKESKKLLKLKESGKPGIFEFEKKRKIRGLENYEKSVREGVQGEDSIQAKLLRKSRQKAQEQPNTTTTKERLEALDSTKRKELKKRVNARRLQREINDRETTEAIHKARLEHEAESARQKAAEDRASFLRSEASKPKQTMALTVTKKPEQKKTGFGNSVKNMATKAWNSKGGKAAIIGGGALATGALVGGGIALHKARKRKAEKEEQENKK
jgi:hypothetical protein